MAIFFIDSMAHYTTHAQLVTKWSGGDVNTVVAGTGAFSAPGSKAQGGQGSFINFVAKTTLELSAYLNLALANGSALIQFYTTAGIQCSLLAYNDGTLKLYQGANAGGALLGTTAAGVISFNAQHHLYIKILFSQTVGTFDMKIDGVSVASTSGLDTCAQATADCTQVVLHGDETAGYNNCVWSHFALADASGDITGQPRIEAIFPDGAGNYSAWTPTAGANYTNVDETTPNDDTDYVASSTAAQRDSYTYSNLLGTATNILAVALVPRVRKDDAVARTVKRFVRAGGTDYDGAVVAVPATYAYLQEVLPTNPATGVAWTVAEVNSIEAGLKVES